MNTITVIWQERKVRIPVQGEKTWGSILDKMMEEPTASEVGVEPGRNYSLKLGSRIVYPSDPIPQAKDITVIMVVDPTVSTRGQSTRSTPGIHAMDDSSEEEETSSDERHTSYRSRNIFEDLGDEEEEEEEEEEDSEDIPFQQLGHSKASQKPAHPLDRPPVNPTPRPTSPYGDDDGYDDDDDTSSDSDNPHEYNGTTYRAGQNPRQTIDSRSVAHSNPGKERFESRRADNPSKLYHEPSSHTSDLDETSTSDSSDSFMVGRRGKRAAVTPKPGKRIDQDSTTKSRRQGYSPEPTSSEFGRDSMPIGANRAYRPSQSPSVPRGQLQDPSKRNDRSSYSGSKRQNNRFHDFMGSETSSTSTDTDTRPVSPPKPTQRPPVEKGGGILQPGRRTIDEKRRELLPFNPTDEDEIEWILPDPTFRYNPDSMRYLLNSGIPLERAQRDLYFADNYADLAMLFDFGELTEEEVKRAATERRQQKAI